MKALILILSVLASIQSFAKGSCQCPDDIDKRGSRCGRRSAFCKPGGNEPICGTKSEKERKDLILNLCYK